MTGITKQVNATLTKKLFKAVVRVKDYYGYSWPEFIVRSAECMDEHDLMQDELGKPVDEYFEETHVDNAQKEE